MIKISPTLLPLPLFINIDWHVTNNVCDSFCVETIHFFYFVQFDLQELQSFCFQSSSCHSFNTSSFLCEYRINNCIEFITGQKFFFLPTGFHISKVSKQRLVFGHFWLFSQNNYSALGWKLKDGWNKRFHKLPRKCPTFLSQRKTEFKFSNESGEAMCASMYLTNGRKSFFFSDPC